MDSTHKIKIIYAKKHLIPSFRKGLDQVAKERIYLELIEAPLLKDVIKFQYGLIKQKAPVFYAVLKDRVIGWCDIAPSKNPRLSHRGSLGMGILREFRGNGIGSKLMAAALKKAKTFGFEKVELQVYTRNKNAIKLYQKFGFKKEGVIQHYRKLNGQYFDAILMAKFL